MIKFTAELTLVPTDQDGRSSPFVGGRKYRPVFSMGDPDRATSLVVEMIRDRYCLAPGETGVIEAALLLPGMFEGRLVPGARFEIREGVRVVGRGTLLAVRDVPILHLDATAWTSPLDIYAGIHQLLGAPSGAGDNLNALPETMLWDEELNAVRPPYHLRITGTRALPKDVRDHLALVENEIYDRRVEHNASSEKQVDVVLETDL